MRILILFLLTSVAVPATSQTVPRFGSASSPGRVITNPPLGGVTSPTLSEDELELIFESLGNLWRATRLSTNIPFENAQPIAELSTGDSAEERPFLTSDGLGLYFSRFTSSPSPTRKIFFSRRLGTTLPFSTPLEVGIEGVSFMEGSIGSVSADELTLYLEIVRNNSPGSGLPQHTDIAKATRPNTNSKFGMWEFLPELNTANLERGPSITRDERTIYFSVQGVGSPGFIHGSTRSDENSPFNPPSLVQGVNTPGIANRDPFIAFPGSRLYYVRNEVLVFSNRILSGTYQIGDGLGLTGRRVLVPVFLDTPEPDAVLFEVPIFFNPTHLVLMGVLPAPGLGESRLEVNELSQGRHQIVYQAERPLIGNGDDEKVFDLEFLISDAAPPGQYPIASGGTYRLNKIEVPSPSSGSVTIENGPSYPAASLLRLR